MARSIAFGHSASRNCGANGGGSTTLNRRGSVKATRRKLQTMAKALRTTGRVGPAPSLSLKPGARLVREWRGRTHTVTVTEEGLGRSCIHRGHG